RKFLVPIGGGRPDVESQTVFCHSVRTEGAIQQETIFIALRLVVSGRNAVRAVLLVGLDSDGYKWLTWITNFYR
ncbi:MAG TPA: hypothetical protein VMH30_04320, partial [Verrucomicrobiae bacterium]|nr:hypothetical protein [Verrucomicrobiae bacterium]